MTESIFILVGIAVGIPIGNLVTEWLHDRALRRRSRMAVLSGDRIVKRAR